MKLVPLSSIFDIWYGVNLELNSLARDEQGVAFVGRSSRRNGITGRVRPIPHIDAQESGLITVAGGGSVLETFVQQEPFYSGRDLYCLRPKGDLTLNEKLFYCLCIRANKYRFNYGRQANRTLKDIEVPALSEVPEWVREADPDMFAGAHLPAIPVGAEDIFDLSWKAFKYKDLFEIERGRGPRKKELNGSGRHPFVSASEFNNGITDFSDAKPFHAGRVITVARNGNSVASAFYQPVPFHSTEDVHVFTPKFRMSVPVALFLCTLIKLERYRYSYGRKWGIARMKETDISLPVTNGESPDWELMGRFVRALPYSSQIPSE
jgi:hypothetical protein